MNHNTTKIDWSMLKAVIFDVDGTLYDQRALHRCMFLALVAYYLAHPWCLSDLKILRDFRREREKNTFEVVPDLENAQYIWGAQANGVSPRRVYDVVQKWIFRIPLRYILCCKYAGVSEFFDNLHSRGIPTVIFSDYPAAEKIAALRLSACSIFCATDKKINRFKPDPKGLFVIAGTLGVSVEQCLLIGDRDDRDGDCARRAGMRYLIIERRCSGMDNRFQTYRQLNEQLNDSS